MSTLRRRPKAATASLWDQNVPNIHLFFDGEQATLQLECTQAEYDVLHNPEIENEPADFLDELNKLVQKANEGYPSAERCPDQDRESLKTEWMGRLKKTLAIEVNERNNTVRTRRSEWEKDVPEGTEEMWEEHNGDEGGSPLPFLFGASTVNTQLGIESRPVDSVLAALSNYFASSRARVKEFRAANESNASTAE